MYNIFPIFGKYNLIIMFENIKIIINSLSNTIFPPFCQVCEVKLSEDENFICSYCKENIPLTRNENIEQNSLFLRIEKLVKIERAISMMHYTSKGNYNKLIQNAKFKNQRKLAVEMGRWLAYIIENEEYISAIDYIIPIPLSKSRRRWRGYNQSEYICKGLSEVLNIPMLNGVVIRHKNSKVQTKIKDIYKRYKNVEGVFSLTDKNILNGKYVLLIDDVITTGATISSCAKIIKESSPKCNIIIGSICSTR